MPNPQIGDNEKAPYAVFELDAAGMAVPPQLGDTLTVVSSNPDAATVVFATTPTSPSALGTGFIVGGTPANNVDVTATLTKADGSTLSATDTVDIIGGPVSSLGFSLGAPVPKA